MKKLIFLFLFTISNHLIFSQAVIPKFGVARTTVAFSEALSQGNEIKEKYGLVAGLGVEFPVNKFIAVQPELLFRQKGWTEEFLDRDRTETYKLNYLEVPVHLKLKFGFFYVSAGPFGAVAMGGKYRYSEKVLGVKSAGSKEILLGRNNKTNPDKLYFDNAFDVGLQGGFGFKILNRVYLDFRYSQSYLDIFDDNGLNDNKSRNRGVELTIGFPSPRD